MVPGERVLPAGTRRRSPLHSRAVANAVGSGSGAKDPSGTSLAKEGKLFLRGTFATSPPHCILHQGGKVKGMACHERCINHSANSHRAPAVSRALRWGSRAVQKNAVSLLPRKSSRAGSCATCSRHSPELQGEMHA